jgi:hypothetical protein
MTAGRASTVSATKRAEQTKRPNVGRGPASNPTITGIEPEWHDHSIEWDRAHLVEQAL